MSATNNLRFRSGKVAAICHICGARSAAVARDFRAEPDLEKLAMGWTQSPFSAKHSHADGSQGSLYTCPKCNGLMRSGYALQTRAYLLHPQATPVTARKLAIRPAQ